MREMADKEVMEYLSKEAQLKTLVMHNGMECVWSDDHKLIPLSWLPLKEQNEIKQNEQR